ncbi:MAG: arsenate reductase (azurin) small subunit [Phycisphaerae bacterium]
MSKTNESEPQAPARGMETPTCTSRRTFLLAGGTVVAGTALATVFPGITFADDRDTVFKAAKYPRKWVADANKLVEGKPVRFFYPYEEPHCSSSIVKLGTKAGGGVGAGKDIVAFNTMCPHMGGTLDGQYCHQVKVQGPCPIHLSTYDLTRHGMTIAGHATEPLPQVVLEEKGGQIYAVGMLGLIYGYASHLAR